MKLTDTIYNHFVAEEGKKLCAYQDHLGYWTIGIGCLLSKDIKSTKYKGLCWTEAEVRAEFEKRFNKAVEGAKRTYGAQFDTFSANRQLAIVDNVFQLGEAGYNTFVNSIKLIKAGDWSKAADNMLLSKWAKQTPNRAKRITELLRKG